MVTRWLATCLIVGTGAGLAPAPAHVGPAWPFGPGEELTFTVASSRFGEIGSAVMRVTGPDTVRGRATYLLAFDFSAKVLFLKASDRTRSWFDPEAGRSLRYTKRERSPFSSHDEHVEIFPDLGLWSEADDTTRLVTDAPLDELSFLYFVRTLPLEDSSVHVLERHFDPGRNPVTVTVLRREPAAPENGAHATVVVEMRVPDRRQQDGTGWIRLHLTDDAARLPVRLESSMPVGGTMIMTLRSYVPAFPTPS